MYSTEAVCIDSTHGTNQFDFQLMSLLVVDRYGEGISMALLFSNHIDTKTLTHPFNVLKNKVGSIKTDIFMSNEALEFYNAWVNVVEVSLNHLLCIWHVDSSLKNSGRSNIKSYYVQKYKNGNGVYL